ncbi:hypothetical protein JCM3765_007061 [Sporobolomyces pararoseus]
MSSTTAAASTAAAAAPAPVFPCPYTAGGCPLFNTIELPKPQTPSCAGGCSPTPSTPSTSTSSSSDPSLKLRPISPQRQRAPSPARLPPLEELAAAYPRQLPGQSSREWNGYLEFGLQPSEVDLAPLYVPFPQGQPSKRSASMTGLWDIEELVPNPPSNLNSNQTSSKRPRTVPPPLPPAPTLPDIPLPLPTPQLHTQPISNGLAVPFDQTRASPSSESDDTVANEVVTPFISKLSYLLDHPEYQPWIRWDASGTNILIAHTKPRLLEILARYFRHTTISSFVRQLNIYGFKRLTTVSLLSILDSTHLPNSILVSSDSPPTAGSTSTSGSSSTFNSPQTASSSSIETFSASDYSAFHNPQFYRSTPEKSCRLGALKPITKERAPRNRSKKAKAEAAARAQEKAEEEARRVLAESMTGGDGFA